VASSIEEHHISRRVISKNLNRLIKGTSIPLGLPFPHYLLMCFVVLTDVISTVWSEAIRQLWLIKTPEKYFMNYERYTLIHCDVLKACLCKCEQMSYVLWQKLSIYTYVWQYHHHIVTQRANLSPDRHFNFFQNKGSRVKTTAEGKFGWISHIETNLLTAEKPHRFERCFCFPFCLLARRPIYYLRS
jgi:hypothetical protein